MSGTSPDGVLCASLALLPPPALQELWFPVPLSSCLGPQACWTTPAPALLLSSLRSSHLHWPWPTGASHQGTGLTQQEELHGVSPVPPVTRRACGMRWLRNGANWACQGTKGGGGCARGLAILGAPLESGSRAGFQHILFLRLHGSRQEWGRLGQGAGTSTVTTGKRNEWVGGTWDRAVICVELCEGAVGVCS